jgi:hypothetical protein
MKYSSVRTAYFLSAVTSKKLMSTGDVACEHVDVHITVNIAPEERSQLRYIVIAAAS